MFFRSKLVEVPEDLRSVTATPGPEVNPARVGMTHQDVAAIWEATEELYRTRAFPAISLCVRRRGEVVIDRAIGHARGAGPDEDGPLVPVRADTPFCVFSTSKAVTAMVIHLLEERGLLHMDDPVAEFIPEFARNGKDRISIRHVLTHRAGIPSVAGKDNTPDLLLDWDRVVRLLCDATPVSAPGRRLAYHAVTGGFILGEIVRRITGRDIREFFAEEFQRPAGWRWLNYGAPGRSEQIATNAFTGPPVPFPVSLLTTRALGVPFEAAVNISNDARYLESIVPAGNVVGTANEVCEFFEMLRQGGTLRGHRFLQPRTVHRATTETSYLELDLTLAFPVRYGLGLMLGGPRVSLFGPDTGRAFGHLGFINVLAWADPARDTSVALLTSGKPFINTHPRALWALLRALSTRCSPAR